MTLNRRLASLLAALVALAVLTSLASAGPTAPGTPTLRWRATANPNVSEIYADAITDGGISGNGAMTWDIYFRFPNSVSAPYPGISITPGPAWTAMSPCGFSTNVSLAQPSEPGSTGDRGVWINGFCVSGIANNPVTGSNILVATITFTNCPASGFLMDLDSGDDVYGVAVAQLADRTGDGYTFFDADLTDGGACGNPTAVQLANISAGPAAPLANALYPAVAGALALAAAAGVAFKGLRKR